jgi:hypothetical protein
MVSPAHSWNSWEIWRVFLSHATLGSGAAIRACVARNPTFPPYSRSHFLAILGRSWFGLLIAGRVGAVLAGMRVNEEIHAIEAIFSLDSFKILMCLVSWPVLWLCPC